MPILPPEVDIFPDDLLDSVEGLGPERSWWVAHTLSRHEKQLVRHLHEREIPFYVPVVAKRNRSATGRVRTSYVVLFPGYVFMLGNSTETSLAKRSNCISGILPVVDGDALRRDLSAIRQLIGRGAPLTVEARIECGQQVRVRSGPLRGLEGVVVKRQSKTRLVVAIHFIQQGASVSVEDCDVEPL